MEQIILDTDVAMGIKGEDIDDGFALAFAIADPYFDLKLVTTVDGNIDVDTATSQAEFLLERLGTDVPVVRGADRPLAGRRRKYWGTLNDMSDNAGADIPAAMRIVRELRSAVRPMTILAIGPLTNIALALLLDPSIKNRIRRLVIMGGRYYGLDWGTGIPGEYNFWADPEAAQIVLDTEINTWLGGTDVTDQVTMNQKESVALLAHGGSFGSYAGQCALDWLKNLSTRSKEPVDEFYLHDPLAVAAASRPEIIGWEDHPVGIVLDGQARGICYLGGAGSICHVARTVDAAAFKQYMFEQLEKI